MPIKAVHLNRPDIAHAVIGMQSLLEMKGPVSGVGDERFELEFGADLDTVPEVEFVGPPLAGLFVWAGDEIQRNDAVLILERFELPGPGADEAVLRGFGVVGFGAKPWEADRNAAANGLAIFKAGLLAQEDDFVVAGGLPGGELCSVQIDLCRGLGRGDLDLGEIAIALDDLDDARVGEAGIEFGDGDIVLHSDSVVRPLVIHRRDWPRIQPSILPSEGSG